MPATAPLFRPGVPGLIPDAWIVTPGHCAPAPAVLAIHGITRGAEEMACHLQPRAEATGRTLVVPLFDKTHWPRYQRAACKDRADWALLRLMTALRAEGVLSAAPVDLSGFSGGAQFAHRFAWLYPDLVGRLCLTAPGWWTLPDPQRVWPYGIGTAPGDAGQGFRLQANLRRFLDRPITVCVGSTDTERDGNLRRGDGLDETQGRNRLERARRWCAQIDARARALGLTPQVSLRVLPGCGHSFTECVVTGGLESDFITSAPPRCAGCRNAGGCKTAATPELTVRTAA
jgi:pimeloyl-ACP methyl ester carboxylesterase